MIENHMIKKILFPIAVLLAATSGAHAGKDGWLTNYDEALTQAKEENKIVLVEFHGSDWCPPCIKLNDEVLSTKAFKKVAKDDLVLLNVDFPRKTKLSEEQREHNQALAEKFGLRGVPMVLLLNHEGEVLDKMVGFPRGGLDGFLSFVKDKTKAAD